ncbi:MAG: UDP-3-O-(3-hydroxymyristoyl)glucosamine N-acyltransferase [Planctomycetota bacterium]
MPRLTADEVCRMVDGQLHGDPDEAITGVASPEQAAGGDLAFIADEEQADEAAECRASVLLAPCAVDGFDGALIVCEDPEMAAREVLQQFAEERFEPPSGIDDDARIADSAQVAAGAAVGSGAVIGPHVKIGEGAVIYPLAYVGPRSRIGPRTTVYPHVTIREDVEVGRDCIIHSNTSIGEDGFGFIQRDGEHLKMPHVGGVRIGNEVEIGALVTVHRAMLDDTVIQDGVKIDAHSHVAHNCRVGAGSLMVGYSKLAGSVELGEGVIMAEDSGVNDHVTVGDGAIVAGGSGVKSDVEAGEAVWGYPARPMGQQRRIWALQGRLPDMHKKLNRLEKEVKELRSRLDDREE